MAESGDPPQQRKSEAVLFQVVYVDASITVFDSQGIDVSRMLDETGVSA